MADQSRKRKTTTNDAETVDRVLRQVSIEAKPRKLVKTEQAEVKSEEDDEQDDLMEVEELSVALSRDEHSLPEVAYVSRSDILAAKNYNSVIITRVETGESALNGEYTVYCFMKKGETEGYYYGMTDDKDGRFLQHKDEASRAKTRNFSNPRKL
uniref:GIY-YIG domain-containing protein n=1 Tax=Rhabditophanes sp. KR3021 TaxID=114890 RepID=A0AC35UCP1_9BILA